MIPTPSAMQRVLDRTLTRYRYLRVVAVRTGSQPPARATVSVKIRMLPELLTEHSS